MASTDLIVPGDDSPYAVLRMDPQDITDLIAENLGNESVGVGDLDRVKVPAGGGTTWEVPTMSGTEALKVIEGVIIHRGTRRAYWKEKYTGQNDPPQCFSDDGVNGQGDPGGPCGQCPFNEFESAGDGIGKACKETRQLFVLLPDSLLPIVVTAPPGSLANAKAYFMRLLRNQMSPLDVVTKISLEKTKSKGGIDFSRLSFEAGDQLDPTAKARLKAFSESLMPAFERASRVEPDEV